MLSVFNTLGQQVALFDDAEESAGFYDVRFDATGLPAGVYLYRLQAGETVETMRLILLRWGLAEQPGPKEVRSRTRTKDPKNFTDLRCVNQCIQR
jgi:hypothetical protein